MTELTQWLCPTCGLVADRVPGTAPFCHHNRPTTTVATRTHQLPTWHPHHPSNCTCRTATTTHAPHCPCHHE